MTLDEFNQKWENSNDQELNEWIAIEIMNFEKTEEGWSKIGLLNPAISPTVPEFLHDRSVFQVLYEVGFNYEFLVHYDIKTHLLHAQIGSKLLAPGKRVLYECTERSFDRAACKISLMLSLHLDCLVDEYC